MKATRVCSVDCCERPSRKLQLCDAHYWRLRRNGSVGEPQLDRRQNRVGDVGYQGMHSRLRVRRGRAAQYSCQHCGAAASDWAYDHADLNEKVAPLGAYSLDPDHYMPLCVSCHKLFDLSVKKAG